MHELLYFYGAFTKQHLTVSDGHRIIVNVFNVPGQSFRAPAEINDSIRSVRIEMLQLLPTRRMLKEARSVNLVFDERSNHLQSRFIYN